MGFFKQQRGKIKKSTARPANDPGYNPDLGGYQPEGPAINPDDLVTPAGGTGMQRPDDDKK